MDLNALRAEITRLRSKAAGKRPYFPSALWEHITKLSEQLDPKILAEELGLNQQNLIRQIRKRKSENSSTQFLEVPSGLLSSSKKQLHLDLPHGVSLRIDL